MTFSDPRPKPKMTAMPGRAIASVSGMPSASNNSRPPRSSAIATLGFPRAQQADRVLYDVHESYGRAERHRHAKHPSRPAQALRDLPECVLAQHELAAPHAKHHEEDHEAQHRQQFED